MIPKCVSQCISYYKIGFLIFLVFNDVGQTYGGLTIKLNNSECGMDYTIGFKSQGFQENAEIEHLGSDILQDQPCYLELAKDYLADYKQICVSGEKIKLDCGTKLEYHGGFIREDNETEEVIRYTCDNVTLDEWCPPTYRWGIYIGIRKSAVVTSDVIRLKVYLKDVKQKQRGALIYALPIIGVVVLALLILGVQIRRHMRRRGYPESNYDANTGAINMQTGDQPYTQDDLSRQQFTNGSQENGNLTPSGQPLLPENGDPRVGVAVPTPAVSPPAYDSVVDKKY